MKNFPLLTIMICISLNLGAQDQKWIRDTTLQTFSNASTKTTTMEFSYDGEYFAYGGLNSSIEVLRMGVDADTFYHFQTLKGHEDSSISLSFSFDNTYLASCGRDNEVIIWKKNEEGIYEVWESKNHGKRIINVVKFSPVDNKLFMGSMFYKIENHRIFLEKDVEEFYKKRTSKVYSIDFGQDGSQAVISYKNWTYLLDYYQGGFLLNINFWGTSKVLSVPFFGTRARLNDGKITTCVKSGLYTFKPEPLMIRPSERKIPGLGTIEYVSKDYFIANYKNGVILYYLFGHENAMMEHIRIRCFREKKKILNISACQFTETFACHFEDGILSIRKIVFPKRKNKLSFDLSILNPNPDDFSSNSFISQEKYIPLKFKVFSLVKNGNFTIKINQNGRFTPHSINQKGETYNTNLELRSGENSIEIQAKDRNGITQTTTLNIHYNKPIGRQGKDYALFFAVNEIDDNSHKTLEFPISDADSIASVLRSDYGFETQVVKNPTKLEVDSILSVYTKKSYHPNDQLFIYLTGHGVKHPVHDAGFFALKDSKENDKSRSTYFSYNDLRQYIDGIPCKHILLVIDACYSGAFFPKKKIGAEKSLDKRDAPIRAVIDKILQKKARLVITSTDRETEAYDGEFARKLLEVFQRKAIRGEKFISMADLEKQIQSLKSMPSSGEFGESDIGADFLFIKQ